MFVNQCFGLREQLIEEIIDLDLSYFSKSKAEGVSLVLPVQRPQSLTTFQPVKICLEMSTRVRVAVGNDQALR